MGFLTNLKDSFGKGKRLKLLKHNQFEGLKESMRLALGDGILSNEELARIKAAYQESQLEYKDFQNICCQAFGELVQFAISDRRITDAEHESIFKIAEQLQLPGDWVNWAKEQIKYYTLFHYIESGGELPVGTPTNVILQKNEVCHLSIPAQVLEERVISRQYVGRSQGVSIRLAKGVNYRIGQQRGYIESTKGLVAISSGYFVVTNKRLIFSGNNKSITSNIDKLVDLQIYSDALQYSVTNRQKPTIVKFAVNEEVEMCALVISRLINSS